MDIRGLECAIDDVGCSLEDGGEELASREDLQLDVSGVLVQSPNGRVGAYYGGVDEGILERRIAGK